MNSLFKQDARANANWYEYRIDQEPNSSVTDLYIKVKGIVLRRPDHLAATVFDEDKSIVLGISPLRNVVVVLVRKKAQKRILQKLFRLHKLSQDCPQHEFVLRLHEGNVNQVLVNGAILQELQGAA